MAHYIRNLPHQNIFVDDVPESLTGYPYFILFICQRIAIELKTSLPAVFDNLQPQNCAEFQVFRNLCYTNLNISTATFRESENVWASSRKNFDGYTFKGHLSFNKPRSTHIFKLELLPLQAEKSCRFQRAFGSDRYLYLDFPAFDFKSKPPNFDYDQWNHIPDQFKEWLNKEHGFLGRRWRAFHIEPIGGKASRRHGAKNHRQRVILFATTGNGIDTPCTIGEMINWFLPIAKNQDQSFCKAFARISLGLSRTLPTLVFKPSQVHYVHDTLADGTSEDTQFDDPTLEWEEPQDYAVMNDGCSVMSVGAARAIWSHYSQATGTNGAMPSAFQGRIGGAKGLWVISTETFTKDPYHLDIWIQISESQLKFKPHSVDYFDETFDPLRLTFELVNHSSCATPSDLHSSFVRIMTDRGIPVNDIAKMIRKGLDFERQQLLSMLQDPLQVYHWIHKKAPSMRANGSQFRAALPQGLDDKIRLLLESGFSSTKSPYLTQCLGHFIKRQHLDQERGLRAPLGKSTNLFGVADPSGVLAPGEIHVQFSVPFVDETSDERYPGLSGLEVLVARHPACRPSDIQKVRAVVNPSLSHLIDIIVFPIQGKYPLAGKLQGGIMMVISSGYAGSQLWLPNSETLQLRFALWNL
jgi:hypothetical protein